MLTKLLSVDFFGVLSLFTVVHQAVVELFKLTGVRARRYADALAFVIYGTAFKASAEQYTLLGDLPR